MAHAPGGPDIEPIDVAVRAWTLRDEPEGEDEQGARSARAGSGGGKRVSGSFLVFDTETTIDAEQRLLFGCWRYYRTRPRPDGGVELVWVAEGLFHPDDLGDWYPAGLETLLSFDGQALDTDASHLDAARRLRVTTQTEFLNRTMYRAAYAGRAGVVCFNSPFDLSRLAYSAGSSRNRSGPGGTVFDGGFSFMLWPYESDGRMKQGHWRPSLAIKTIDSKRAFKGFKGPEHIDEVNRLPDPDEQVDPDRPWKFRGHFLDLRTLVFALTDRGHTLQSANKAMGVAYTKRDVTHGVIEERNVTYCREDVEATARLLEASLNEFLRHPISLQATRAYSPATIGKGYLRKMRVRPPRERQEFDPVLLGHAMSAYYGGRAECRIRKEPVPVVYCDFLSMYPTVCRLMNIWKLLTAQSIEPHDATDDVQRLLDDLTPQACFDPELWSQLVGIAQVLPDGQVLPVRARYSGGQSWQIGVNPLQTSEPMWFTIADLAAARLLSPDKPLKIIQAIRFAPSAKRAAGLKPVQLLGEVDVDPRERDFFQTVVEERKRAEATEGKNSARAKGLKVLANATSYGIYAQMTRHPLPKNEQEDVTIYGARAEPHRAATGAPEDPGDYAFPPIACAITGAARLMLALLERSVTDLGGTYAFCDTDSMAIVATKTGGLTPCHGGSEQLDGKPAIRALSDRQVSVIREQFNALNPYENAPGTDSILELEEENYLDPETRKRRLQLWCYAISAKRYVLYNVGPDNTPTVRGYTAVDSEESDDDSDEAALRKSSQHGLGHLLNPTDPKSEDRGWIQQAWQHLLTEDLDLQGDPPDWLDQPAVAQTTISTPALLKTFAKLNKDRPYQQQIKPFNFLNVALVDKAERPHDDQKMVLVTPYEPNREKWLSIPWTNRYSTREYQLTTEPSGGRERPGLVTPKLYRDILTDYLAHEESKSLDPTGGLCEPGTNGLLPRRPVTARSMTHIGKEANQLEDTLTGLIADQDETLNQYDNAEEHYFNATARPILRDLGVRETARQTGHSLGAVQAALREKDPSTPRATQLAAYNALAARIQGPDV